MHLYIYTLIYIYIYLSKHFIYIYIYTIYRYICVLFSYIHISRNMLRSIISNQIFAVCRSLGVNFRMCPVWKIQCHLLCTPGGICVPFWCDGAWINVEMTPQLLGSRLWFPDTKWPKDLEIRPTETSPKHSDPANAPLHILWYIREHLGWPCGLPVVFFVTWDQEKEEHRNKFLCHVEAMFFQVRGRSLGSCLFNEWRTISQWWWTPTSCAHVIYKCLESRGFAGWFGWHDTGRKSLPLLLNYAILAGFPNGINPPRKTCLTKTFIKGI